MTTETKPVSRAWIARGFTIVEDVVYIGLGLLLAASALALLANGTYTFAQTIASGTLVQNIITLLDRILLIMLVVELLYTVQVSFREHTIAPEPFLCVQAVTGLSILGVLLRLRRRGGSDDEMVWRGFVLTALWFVTFGPSVESQTFLLAAVDPRKRFCYLTAVRVLHTCKQQSSRRHGLIFAHSAWLCRRVADDLSKTRFQL